MKRKKSKFYLNSNWKTDLPYTPKSCRAIHFGYILVLVHRRTTSLRDRSPICHDLEMANLLQKTVSLLCVTHVPGTYTGTYFQTCATSRIYSFSFLVCRILITTVALCYRPTSLTNSTTTTTCSQPNSPSIPCNAIDQLRGGLFRRLQRLLQISTMSSS